MRLEKNWFYHFCIALSIAGMGYILIAGVSDAQGNQEYPYAMKGLLILIFFLTWAGVNFLALLSARLSITEKLKKYHNYLLAMEVIYVILILILAFAARLFVIRNLPMEPASDYKTYYEIAKMLKEGVLQEKGEGYCNYIGMFPHILGYCFILKTIFVVFGTSIWNGQIANVLFSVGTVFLIYRIARKLGGRMAGLTALTAWAFWPSQILYVNMLAAEYSFSFFLYLCVLLFLHLVMDYDGATKHGIRGVLLHMVLGCLIAVTAAIRPMAVILLIAILIFLIPLKSKLPEIPHNSISVWVRFLARGFMRAALMVLAYMAVSSVLNTDIELTINKSTPSFSQSFGYNLLVGLNQESDGGWNEEDSRYLYENLERTGSPIEAQIACRNLAFKRLSAGPGGLFNLFIKKYELLWENDNYGADWNLAFLKEQNELTPDREVFLNQAKSASQIVYMVAVLFSFLTLIYLLQRKASSLYVLVLVYLGTAAMHLMVESQNRYHFHILPVFIIIASVGIKYIFENAVTFVNTSDWERQQKKEQQIREETVLKQFELEEHKAIEQRYKSMTNAFDMQSAILNGNVTVTVSEAYTQPDPFMKEKKEVSAAEIPPKISQEKETEKMIKKEKAGLEHSDLEELILELEEIAETGKVPKEHDEGRHTV
ncbi:ArnT family glycosyltransferase [Lacrimispora sp. AGF001]|uniref:ArnT family glycosyltransferase n=1 Tax=Lacrimispora sp. AGF001 TaxID=3401631 RepID=UPI003B43868C